MDVSDDGSSDEDVLHTGLIWVNIFFSYIVFPPSRIAPGWICVWLLMPGWQDILRRIAVTVVLQDVGT